MKERVQFLADAAAKDRYHRTAWSHGLCLSAWMRQIADAASEEEPERLELATRGQLEGFFGRSNDRVAALAVSPFGNDE